MGVCNSKCADLISLRQFDRDKTPSAEKKKGGKGTEPLTAVSNTDYANGHPYPSVIYDVLRVARKATKAKS